MGAAHRPSAVSPPEAHGPPEPPPDSTGPLDAVAVVLAAGQGRRFGATKQLAELDGSPLVAHAVAIARAAGCARVVTVVGHDAERVADAARLGGPTEIAVNDDHRSGQASSLRTGIAAAAEGDQPVAVVLLADQPGVRPEAVRAVVDAVRQGAIAARARYDDGPSHPVAFARALWPRLQTVTGDRGARDLLDDLNVALVPVHGSVPPDVDVPGDLE